MGVPLPDIQHVSREAALPRRRSDVRLYDVVNKAEVPALRAIALQIGRG